MDKIRLLLVPVFILVLSGCFPGRPLPLQPSASPAPQTTTIIETGIISVQENRTTDGSTHLLTTDEGKKLLLKSTVVDLGEFEDDFVTVTGETAAENHSSQKQVTVFAVDRKTSPADERLSLFNETLFGFSMRLPGNWQRSLSADGKVLHYFPEDAKPVISISALPQRGSAGIEAQSAMRDGTPVTVGGKSGARVLKNGGVTDLFVALPEKQQIITFHFAPGRSPDKEKIVFYEMLTSLSWTEDASNTPAVSAAVSPLVPVSCGGSAKKLCPDGFRCELESFDENATGVCVDADLPPSNISESLSINRKNSQQGPNLTASPTPDIQESTVENRANIQIDETWAKYENAGFSYSYALPKSWWWLHLGSTKDSLSRLLASPLEVDENNWQIAIDVVSGELDKRTESATEGIIKIVLPKDNITHFVVTGKSDVADIARKVADSLFSL